MDTLACMSVNDAFVLSKWMKSLEAEGKVTMLADGGAAFAESSGLAVKTGNFGGSRLNRLAMIVSSLASLGFDRRINIGRLSTSVMPSHHSTMR